MKLYINGVLEASTTGATGTRSAPPSIRIGSIQTGIQYFNGTIDELRIWNVVRSQSDIQSNMNSEIGTSSSLVEYYRFNQGNPNGINTITTLTDTSGNNNTGTLYNFALTGTTSNWTNGVITAPGTYYYRVEIQATGCTVVTYPNVVSVSVLTPPTGGSVSSYAGTSGTINLSGNTGTVTKWQKSTDSGVTWTDIANTTTSYSFTNQTDGVLFRAVVTNGSCTTYSQSGLVSTPFTYNGYVYDSENTGINAIPVKLYYKVKSQLIYTLYGIYPTDSTGKYLITTTLASVSNDFRIALENIPISAPTINDAYSFNTKVLNRIFNSKDFYRMDVNNDNSLSVTDIFLIYFKSGGSSGWTNSTPTYRIFTPAEWSQINSGTANLKSTYPGLPVMNIDGILTGGSTNFYLIRTGYLK